MKIVLYLAVVIAVSSVCLLSGYFLGRKSREKELCAMQNSNYKNSEFYKLVVKWLFLKQIQESIEDYFDEKHYSKIAIYGMHYLGERLLKELEGSNIQVLYGIDRNADNINCRVSMIKPEDDLPKVDVIIVTAIADFESIKKMLQDKVAYPVVSLKDVIEYI